MDAELDELKPCAKRGAPLVSAAELARALPEYFSERNQVLRMAKSRVIPCYVLPATRRSRGGEFRFRVRDVRKAMEGYYQPTA